jgi:hypothetical protein
MASNPKIIPVTVAPARATPAPARATPAASSRATPAALSASLRPAAPHSAVPVQPAATSRIPAAPHPAAVPRASKLGAAMATKSAPAPAPRPVNVTVLRSPAAASSLKSNPKTPKFGDAPASPSTSVISPKPVAKPAPPPAAAVTAKPPVASKPAVTAKPAITQSPAAAAKVNFKLPAAVYSPQLLESVIYDIQVYLDWIRQNQIRKQVGAKAKDEPNHSDETVLVIEAWLAGRPATLETIEALQTYLRELKLPQIHIMLAALPNRTQRLALVDWFRNNASPELLLSFVADRNLGGGIVVRTPNRVFDFSWKQELVAGRSKLAEILKRV